MQGKGILVVGYGKLGRRVAHNLSKKHDVIALKRSPIEQVGKVKMCFADVTRIENLKEKLPLCVKDGIDYLIYCLSPSEYSKQGYRDAYLTGLQNIIASLPNTDALKHIIFISSTSVYHQSNGEEVDELSSCSPSAFSGKVLLEAESYIAGLNVASTSIRFSGIYGGDRSRLIEKVKHTIEQGEVLEAAPGYTNRIHEDDCLGFICHLIDLLEHKQELEACYIGTDSCPVEQAEVYQFIAAQLQGSDHNEQAASLSIEETDSAKSKRRAGSKRCKNDRMKQSAYVLKYTSYKEGYAGLLKGAK
ncbi:MAG: nucleoside-diphosphate-sugar epimerase [Oleiphilaceae bacterium]|jgi:nucleoside-diphosphate-sugar epimerase